MSRHSKYLNKKQLPKYVRKNLACWAGKLKILEETLFVYKAINLTFISVLQFYLLLIILILLTSHFYSNLISATFSVFLIQFPKNKRKTKKLSCNFKRLLFLRDDNFKKKTFFILFKNAVPPNCFPQEILVFILVDYVYLQIFFFLYFFFECLRLF